MFVTPHNKSPKDNPSIFFHFFSLVFEEKIHVKNNDEFFYFLNYYYYDEKLSKIIYFILNMVYKKITYLIINLRLNI